MYRQRLEGNGYIPGQRATMRYQERGLVHNLGIITCMLESRVDQSRMIIKANNQSINHKVTYVGLPPKPIYFAWINITDSIIPELWKKTSMPIKIKRSKRLRVEMDPANRECLTSQAIRGIWIVGCRCSPGKRYQRIQTCLTGEVESPSSPIRRQA